MPPFTDTHAHLSYVLDRQGQSRFDEIVREYAGCAARILDPGVIPGDYPARKEAFAAYPFIHLAAGIWPDARFLESRESSDEALSGLEGHVADKACFAVGECGLDYHWMHGSAERQASLFGAQIDLALRYGKPLIVHSREAHADTLRLVTRAAAGIPVVIHCFGYGGEAALEYLAAGCYISFAGNVTYKNARDLQAAAAVVPLDRLLVETDAPYMNTDPCRGKPSSPLDIGRTYAFLAKLRGVEPESLEESVGKNAKLVFGPAW